MTIPFPPFPPFPANPAVGQRFGSWVWTGAQWIPAGNSGPIISIQTFAAVGQTLTYIPAPGLITAIVECFGGGGAGGQAGPTPNASWAMGGGGGGSGGYSRKILPASLVLGGVNVTIGEGGSPGPAITNGTATSFGALCVANGGNSGVGNDITPNGAGQGAAGASPGIGDVALPGSGGVDGIMIWYTATQSAQLVNGGIGGSLIGGAIPSNPVGQGAGIVGAPAWPNSGAGGSGAALNQMATGSGPFLGGAGGSGLCIVTEYSSGDFGGGSGCAPIPITDNSCIGWGPGSWR